MFKRNSKRKLGRTKAHREAMIKNQIRSVFSQGYVVTTTPKAKALKENLSSFLHKGKTGNLEITRYMHMVLGKKELVQIAKEYIKNSECKVKILKISFRDGDASEMSKVILEGYDKIFKKEKVVKKTKNTKEKKKEEVVNQSGSIEQEGAYEKKEKVEKNLASKLSTDIKGKFTKKERSRSRSGL